MRFVRREKVLLAVDRPPAGCEYHPADTRGDSRLQERQNPEYVHRSIEDRIGDGPADIHLRRVMVHDVETALGKETLDGGGIPYVEFVEPGLRVEVFLPPRRKIVDHTDAVSEFDVCIHDVGGNESCAPGNEYFHASDPFPRCCPLLPQPWPLCHA